MPGIITETDRMIIDALFRSLLNILGLLFVGWVTFSRHRSREQRVQFAASCSEEAFRSLYSFNDVFIALVECDWNLIPRSYAEHLLLKKALNPDWRLEILCHQSSGILGQETEDLLSRVIAICSQLRSDIRLYLQGWPNEQDGTIHERRRRLTLMRERFIACWPKIQEIQKECKVHLSKEMQYTSRSALLCWLDNCIL